MQKIIKTLLCVTCLHLGGCTVFAEDILSETDKKQKLLQQLVIQPTNEHWLLAKFAGWKMAAPVTIAGLLTSGYLLDGGIRLNEKIKEHNPLGLRAKPQHDSKIKNIASSVIFHLALDPETKDTIETSYSLKNTLYYSAGGLCILTILSSWLISSSTEATVKRPFFEAFERYLVNWEENKEVTPEKLIPLFERLQAEYLKAENPTKYIEQITPKILKNIFSKTII